MLSVKLRKSEVWRFCRAQQQCFDDDVDDRKKLRSEGGNVVERDGIPQLKSFGRKKLLLTGVNLDGQ